MWSPARRRVDRCRAPGAGERRIRGITEVAESGGRDEVGVHVIWVLCLIGFGLLAWRALPHPCLARTGVASTVSRDPGVPRSRVDDPAGRRARGRCARSRHRGRYPLRHRRVDVQITLDDDEDLTATLRAVRRTPAPRSSARDSRTAPGTSRVAGVVHPTWRTHATTPTRSAVGFALVAFGFGFGFGDAILCLLGAALSAAAVSYWHGELDLTDLQERFAEGAAGVS